MLFSSHVFVDFPVNSVTDFCFGSIVLREYSLYNFSFFKLIDVCFMAWDMLCLGKCSMVTWKESCCCWVEFSINVNLLLLVDGVAEFFLVLADFLSSSVKCWEWGIEVSSYKCQFVSFQFYQFPFSLFPFSSALQLCCLMHMHWRLLCLGGLTLLLWCLSVSLVNFCMEVYFLWY